MLGREGLFSLRPDIRPTRRGATLGVTGRF